MKASPDYPIYTAVAVASDGTKYQLKNVTTDLILDEPEGELANKVSLALRNAKAGGKNLSSILALNMRIYIYADDGEKKDEVLRGFIWEVENERSDENTIKIKVYDHLIFLQSSKDCIYYPAGRYTDSVVKSICNRWKIKCEYAYEKIKHPKLPLNNKNISDMIIEVLDAVKKQKGTKYVIRSVKDTLKVLKVGTNSTIYHFQKKKGIISTRNSVSMDGVVTKVVIYGKEDKNERRAVAATVNSPNSSKYGTLQDIVTISGDTTLAEAKKEANEIIKEKGKPEKTYSLEAPDIPWVHKGDKIKVTDSILDGYFIVKSVSHDALEKTMSMEVEKA